MVLDSVTIAGKVCLLFHLVALVFFLVGFSVPYWFMAQVTKKSETVQCSSVFDCKIVSEVVHEQLRCGLWDCCGDYLGQSGCFSIATLVTNTKSENFSFLTSDWYRATQVLACLALIAIIANSVVRLLSINCKSPRLYLVSFILDFVVVALIFQAASVFRIGNKADLSIKSLGSVSEHFGFFFNIIGGIFFTGTAICSLIEFLRKK